VIPDIKDGRMTEHFFDLLSRRASTLDSRRGIVAVLAGLALGGAGSALFGAGEAEAHHHKKRNRRKKKGKKNNGGTPALDCIGSCTGKACGDNGCGDSCGTCGAGQTCAAGSCLCASGFKPCQDACIPLANCCTSTECGAASCSNGTCDCTGQPDGTDCGSAGQCVTGVCTPPPTCAGLLGTCLQDEDCCSDFCQGGGQCACSEAGEACHNSADCCQFPDLQDCVNLLCAVRYTGRCQDAVVGAS